ncbi:hypothetical protein ACM55H_15625 [Flavobacterium sp. ZT3R17]|uniref:hypothetical protein n=1 Tax=Flavobacterium cryoconiti TaxID=3398736 RepID=UPI003A87AFDD
MKNFYLLLIVVLGLFLMPTSAFACKNHSEKGSCNKETSSKTHKDDCCCSNDNHSKNKNHDTCGGKCGHLKCGCPSTNTAFTSSYQLKSKNTIFTFSSEKQKFYHSETFISSGFHSLWLIPKIS